MVWFFLFIFGLAIGSFLNVVILRYDGERFLFSAHALGGRSHCMHCKKTLSWYELIPVLSYAIQGGRCRSCKTTLNPQYPIVELLSGFIFLLVPLRAVSLFYGSLEMGGGSIALAAFWVILFELLLVISVIDIRMGIIPDELNAFMLAIGIAFTTFLWSYGSFFVNASLFGPFGLIFGTFGNVILDHLFGALFAGALFWFLVWITPRVFHQEGMGMGDVKLAVPLGFFLGWPDIALAVASAFVVGAVGGIIAIIARKKTMKGTVPFGPFLAIAVALVFFFGAQLLSGYFSLIGIG